MTNNCTCLAALIDVMDGRNPDYQVTYKTLLFDLLAAQREVASENAAPSVEPPGTFGVDAVFIKGENLQRLRAIEAWAEQAEASLDEYGSWYDSDQQRDRSRRVKAAIKAYPGSKRP